MNHIQYFHSETQPFQGTKPIILRLVSLKKQIEMSHITQVGKFKVCKFLDPKGFREYYHISENLPLSNLPSEFLNVFPYNL